MRKKCIVCGADLYEKPLYTCKNMPAQSQDLPDENSVNLDRPIDFDLCQCSGCGLVQFNCDPVSYYLDSTRAGERSAVLVKMRREQYKHLIEKYGLSGKRILEIGAGKGGFLKTLKEMDEYDVQGYGIENNEEFVKFAREEYNVNVVQCNPESDDWTHKESPFDAFMTFAYPARLINPNAMFKSVYKNLKNDGVGIVQVPSLEHLLQPGGFYDITADHMAYYNLSTLRFLLEKNGFEILEEGEIGSVYIFAIVRKKSPYNLYDIWSDVDRHAERIRDFCRKEVSENRSIGAWCAGHFSFTILSTTGIAENIKYIIDNAKFKQGKYSPATHLPIVSPEHFFVDPVDTIIVLGPFYSEEIVEEIKTRYNNRVRIVVVDRGSFKVIKS